MIRIPMLSSHTSPGNPPARRWSFFIGAGPAVLLLSCALLAAGCGQDDQRVPETYPSGARPAPVSAADLAAARVELPPPPPAEPVLEPAPAGAPAPVVGRPPAPPS